MLQPLIGKQSTFYIWYEAGICFVGDITDQHGTSLSKECLATKYNITINHLNYLGIIHTIKKGLKQNEIVNPNPNPNCCFTRPYIPIHIQNINRSKSGNNYVYDILNNND